MNVSVNVLILHEATGYEVFYGMHDCDARVLTSYRTRCNRRRRTNNDWMTLNKRYYLPELIKNIMMELRYNLMTSREVGLLLCTRVMRLTLNYNERTLKCIV